VRRHVWKIAGNDLLDAADEEFLRYLWAPEIAGASAEPARVVERPKGVDLIVGSSLHLHTLEELLAVVHALAAFRDVQGLVFHQPARPPHPMLEDRFEAIGAGQIIKSEIGKVEIDRVTLTEEVVSWLHHAILLCAVGRPGVWREVPVTVTRHRILPPGRFSPLDSIRGLGEN